MNKDQYLRMVEQTGEEIDWDRIPPDIEDFPESVITALNIYNLLGNKIFPDIGFIGKDHTLLEYLFKRYEIESEPQKDWVFELLAHMENNDVAESQRKIKSEYDKAKRK